MSMKPGAIEYPPKTEDIIPMDFKSVWEAMEDCQRQGLTKSIGVSNFTPKKLDQILACATIPPAVNQVELNPYWQQKKLRDYCKANGIIVAAFSPLGAAGTSWGSSRVMESEVLNDIAKAKGKSVAQVCLRWEYEQGVAKPNVLERFLENKEDIAKLRKCFAGLWSLDDSNTVKDAIERPEFYVMKLQREGGGNNIYGDDVRKTLLRLQVENGEEYAAYILMQRIFPTIAPTFLMRDGICHKDHAISELGIYSAYLRNKENVIMNEQCGYLMRTKVSSSNEGGVAAGFAGLS